MAGLKEDYSLHHKNMGGGDMLYFVTPFFGNLDVIASRGIGLAKTSAGLVINWESWMVTNGLV